MGFLDSHSMGYRYEWEGSMRVDVLHQRASRISSLNISQSSTSALEVAGTSQLREGDCWDEVVPLSHERDNILFINRPQKYITKGSGPSDVKFF